VGKIEQAVPAYSAVRKNGERLYKRARRGEDVEPPVRSVRIHSAEIVSFRPPELTLDIRCGKGTYIRQIAEDLGERLGCGGHLAALRRTRVGPLIAGEALDLNSIARAAEDDTIEDQILPMRTIGWNMEVAEVGGETARRLGHGQPIPANLLNITPVQGQLVAVCLSGADLVSVVRIQKDRAHPIKVFPGQIG
jgi:tRNA pseudouridine55 synthase